MTVRIDTVTGPIESDALGLTLTHEHLANSIMSEGGLEPDPEFPDLFHEPVTASNAWLIRERPYGNIDNNILDDDEAMIDELRQFRAVGGSTILETTPVGEGRSPARVKRMSAATGVTVVMGGGWYLEPFHPRGTASWSIDRMVEDILLQYRPETADDGIVAGLVGEIGVSPSFTEKEHRSLRAACLVQREVKKPIMVHLPGWKRYGHEVLDIVLNEFGIDPTSVILAHMDPSASDPDYQRSIAERGVFLEFDMIGMPFLYPVEGQSPSAGEAALAIAHLVERGHEKQVLMSHDLFMKTMLRKHGGNGLAYVPTLFADRLRRAGVDGSVVTAMMTENPRAVFENAAQSA